MSLKLGAWKMNDNGGEKTLLLESIDANGGIKGQIEAAGVTGFWDETSRTIAFSVTVQMQNLRRIYKGVLFSTPMQPEPGHDTVWTIVGFCQFVDPADMLAMGGNARRNMFGWYAQLTEIL